MRIAATSLLATALAAAPAYAQAPNFKEGLWEITARMEMAGMPGGMPPQVMRQCLTRKDVDDPRRMAPTGPQDDRCQVSDYKMQGGTATWSFACKGPEEMRGSGSMTVSGTTYSGFTRMTMTQGGQTQTMTMNYSGKHVGDCKP